MKRTRNSFIFSVIALILCLAMMTSTTFAWFTDSQAVRNNKIQAGTLDVDFLMASFDTTNNAYGEYVSLATYTDPAFNYSKWEPGYSVGKLFKVVNKGNLALEYSLAFDITKSKTGLEVQAEEENGATNTNLYYHLKEKGATAKLENSLRVYISGTDVGTLKQVLDDPTLITAGRNTILLPGESTEFGEIKIVMPTTEGNATENASIEFDIKLFATQYTYEYDGFSNNQYDKLAYTQFDNIDYSRFNTIESATDTISNSDTVLTTGNNIAEFKSGYTEVTFPQTIASFTDGSDATLIVEATPIVAANNLFTVSSDQGAAGAIDLKVVVDGQQITEFKDSNGNPVEVTVKTYIAKGLTFNSQTDTVNILYNGTGDNPTFVSYDSTTGLLVFKTKHFSQFLIEADQVAYIERNNTAYLTLEDAWVSTTNGDKVVMLKDEKMAGNKVVFNNATSTAVLVKYSVELDLNNHTLDLNSSYHGLYNAYGKDLTISNGKIKSGYCCLENKKGTTTIKNAILETTGRDCCVWLSGSKLSTATNYSNLVIDENSTIKSSNYYGLGMATKGYDDGYGVVVDISGKVDAGSALTVNGTYGANTNIIFNINETGEISTGFYMPCDMTVNVYGSVKGAIYQRNGVLNVYDTAYIESDEGYDDNKWYHTDSGYIVMGNCIFVEACHYGTGHAPKANIYGGEFKQLDNSIAAILVVNNADTADMSGTKVPYRVANLATYSGAGESNPYYFTESNTDLITPSN